jgi:hypothetical protein
MTNLQSDVATLVSKINAAYASTGATYTALTTAGITVAAGTTTVSSAGTVAPFFGMLVAMLFAVLSF